MDSKSSLLKNILPYLALILICALYFLLRLSFTGTIEFGYDQPLLAIKILEFLKTPTFINSYNFVIPNPWGYPSWGPAQIFFWVPFLLISKDPTVISQLAVFFNLISIVTIFFLGKKFFSNSVGVIAALVLTTHPWSVIFLRMIYEPTPIITFITLSMFLSFYILENPKTKLLVVLPLAWIFLYQIYIHTSSFIAVSIGALLLNFRKISKKYIALGIVLSVLFLLPVFNFFSKHPSEIVGFSRVSNKFEELRQETPYQFRNTIFEFFGTVGGGRLKWQLGYGYDDFVSIYPWVVTMEKVGYFVVIFLILYHLVKSVSDKELRIKRLLLLFWLACPILFLAAIKTPVALPRYFLLSLPPLSLLFALMVQDVGRKIKAFNPVVYIIPVSLALLWSLLIFKSYDFILTYKYGNGFLSTYSDVPYSFLKSSFDWIEKDAVSKGYDDVIVSSDFGYPKELRLNTAQRYYWDNIFEPSMKSKEKEGGTGYYLMYFTPVSSNHLGDYEEFGPYAVYEYKD